MNEDRRRQALETERLGERVAILESRRAALMAAVRHMQKGLLDQSYLDDVLRSELADTEHGVLLETIEVEIDCLRHRMAELKRGGGMAEALRRWRDINWQINAGALDHDDAMKEAIEAGLARRTMGPGPPASLQELWTIEPARGEYLVPGPLLLVGFQGRGFGGPRLYRPISDELRADTGPFS